MARTPSPAIRCLGALIVVAITAQQCNAQYYGKLIGKLSSFHHGVSGEVYAVDARTLFIKDFNYDGEAPAAWFFAGNSKTVGVNGFKLRDEQGTLNPLKRYRKKDVTLTLPEGKTLSNIKWFSVWCEEFAINFGDVKIPRNFEHPRPQKLAGLAGVHGVSSEPVVVVDAQTLLLPSFSYDGEAPDAKFWVGSGPSPSPQGIRVPDENGKEVPLRRYDRKTIVLTLPGELTIHQLGHFGVWCEAFAVDFGHIQIPQSLNVPPSLKMLGVSPQSKLNCEVLDDGLAFEVRWAVAGDSIVVQLVGKLGVNEYMSFGLSGDPKRSQMVGGDVVVAWVDKQTLQGYAIDYYLDAKSQCSGGRGSCPDLRIQDNSNSVRLLNAAMVNGYSIVTYQRPLKSDDELDHQIYTNGSQAIIWGVGPLNDKGEVSFHSHYLRGDRFIEFSRPPAWNCPISELSDEPQPPPLQHQQQQQQSQQLNLVATTRRPLRPLATPAPAPKTDAWEIPPIQCFEPDDGVLYAQMGPTGGKHGYPAITGHVGWGISWYINGLLIPEIHVVRGKKYTFVVEGGDNPEAPALYHPFYITDDPVGGYQHKTPEERANVTIYAGVRRQRGVVRPTGIGRSCNWTPDQNLPPADEFSSFGAYQRTLTLICEPGEPGIVTWVPDENTPDTVYYQCFTHRYLGWKIHVHDTCDVQPQGSASEQHEVRVQSDPEEFSSSLDLKPEASIRASPSKVTPSPEFLQRHQEYAAQDYDYTRNHHNHHHNKLISGLYHHHNHGYHNYNRFSSPNHHHDHHYLTHIAAEDRRRAPYDAIGYMIQRGGIINNNNHNNNNNHHNPFEQAAYFTQEQQPSSYLAQADVNQSKLITDQHHVVRRPSAVLSAPSAVATGQNFVYSLQPPPPQQNQIMMLSRRPTVQAPAYFQMPIRKSPMTSSMTPFQQPPLVRPPFYERKKAVFKGPMTSRMQTLIKPNYHQQLYYHHQPTKFMKFDLKQQQQRIKIEAKATQAEALSAELQAIMMRPMPPARNTGFDPSSIVIEKGFKPILKRNHDSDSSASNINQFDSRSVEIMLQDEEPREATTERYSDNFEPVFIPSPPDRNTAKKQAKKKTQLVRTKLKLDNNMDIANKEKEQMDYAFMYLRSPKTGTSLLITEEQNNSAAINTPLARTKRHAQIRSEDWDLTYRRDHDPDTVRHDNHDLHGHSEYDHRNHNIHEHEHHRSEQELKSASTGEIIFANIEYIVLTVVLYYAL
ncbi:protein Skeletor, isoforms B/C [Phymastichus coffea]|uniref:protein Skeletor, isoforms B/C n=1 Tax=Phymastichus coffea TaxID=108790 RepID=UPI00273AB3F9|nr:protein Skeletor, isoforms B/C [Phymastichus coffea]